jgi:excisionase family DNA binding protein
MAKKRTEEGPAAGQAVVKVTDPVTLSARGGASSALEAAFLAFLQSKAAPTAVVPFERRIFLSVAEAAEFSGLPLSFVRGLIASGKLKAFRTGSGWRIPRQALEALPDALTNPTAPLEDISEHELRDIELNRLRRQGLIAEPDDWPTQD